MTTTTPANAMQQAKDLLLPGITAVLNRPETPVEGGADAKAVAKAVTNEAAAVLVNQTNNEPWWQSRVTLSAIGGIISILYIAILDFADGSPPPVEVLMGYLTGVGTQAGVLYGRYIAKKPLGQ